MTVEPMPAIEPVTDEDVYFARMRAPRAGSGLSNDDFQNILEQDRRRVAERQARSYKREKDCATADDWRHRSRHLEAEWGRCSQQCAVMQGERDAARAEVAQLTAAQATMIDATGAVETGVFWYSGRYVVEIPKSMALSRVLIVPVRP